MTTNRTHSKNKSTPTIKQIGNIIDCAALPGIYPKSKSLQWTRPRARFTLPLLLIALTYVSMFYFIHNTLSIYYKVMLLSCLSCSSMALYGYLKGNVRVPRVSKKSNVYEWAMREALPKSACYVNGIDNRVIV